MKPPEPPRLKIYSLYVRGSPLLNRRKIQDLLPENGSMASLKKKWDTVSQNFLRNRDTMERQYNLRRRPNPFKSGELVYYKNHPISYAGKREAAKLVPRYKGPFRIESFLTRVTAKLVDTVDGRFIKRTQISMLKPGSHD
jgi:hypothetical protein